MEILSLSKNGLFTLALLLWCFGAYKVLSISIDTYSSCTAYSYLWLVISLAFFMGFIFPKACKSNRDYINSFSEVKLPFYKCQKLSSWFIMIFMIGLGISLRKFALVPEHFIFGFYLGLGLSLLCVSLYVYGSAILENLRLNKDC